MFPRLRGRWRWLALGGVLCVVAAGAAAAILLTIAAGRRLEPGRRVHRHAGHEPHEHPAQAEAPATSDGRRLRVAGLRLHEGSARATCRSRRRCARRSCTQWRVTGRELIEFPPVLCRRSLYLLKNNGALYKISRLTGRVRWKAKLGYLAASSPACAGGSVYAVVLARGKGIKGGRVIALDAKNGRVRWSRKLPSRAESSPLVASGRVYFGTEDGTVYALRASDGAVRWRYKAGGAVKGGLALDQGQLFFGDYGGKVHAIRQRDGSPIWETSSAGTRVRPQGRAASTRRRRSPTGASTSARSTASSTRSRRANGKLAWRHKTGSYVYSSPAVASVPGAGPTVYIGSYDGTLYALRRALGQACAGRATRAARSPAARRRRRPRLLLEPRAALVGGPRRRHRQARVGDRPRRLQPGHLRRPADLLPGLLEPVHALLAAPRRAATSAPATASPAQAGAGAARAKRKAGPRQRPAACAATSARSRAAWRRGAPRCAATQRLRRQHRAICFKSHGRTVCRVPRPLVCVTHHNGPTVCRPRKRLGRRRRLSRRRRLRLSPAAGSVPPAAASSTGAGVCVGAGAVVVGACPSGAVVVVSGWVVVSCGCVPVLVVWSVLVVFFSSVFVFVVEVERRATAAEDRRVVRAADHRAPGDELGQRHHRDGDDAGEQAGGDGELPAPAGGALAAGRRASRSAPDRGPRPAAAARRPRAAARPRPASRAPAAGRRRGWRSS